MRWYWFLNKLLLRFFLFESSCFHTNKRYRRRRYLRYVHYITSWAWMVSSAKVDAQTAITLSSSISWTQCEAMTLNDWRIPTTGIMPRRYDGTHLSLGQHKRLSSITACLRLLSNVWQIRLRQDLNLHSWGSLMRRA